MNIYGLSPISSACHWYRIREPLRALAGLGHTTMFGELFEESLVQKHDTILTHILHDEQASQAWEWLAEEGQHRLVYDVDDNLWRYPPNTEHAGYWTKERKNRVVRNLELAHLVTTPSHVIADYLAVNVGIDPRKIAVLPNYIPRWTLDIQRTTPPAFTVGFQGAPQRLHQEDLDTIAKQLYMFLDKCRDARLLFLGQPHALEGGGPFTDRIDFIPWTPDVPEYYRSLHNMTVGIAPLAASPFTDGKSAVRAAEYHALGIPALYSSRPPYRHWVQQASTGYLISFDKDWRRELTRLYNHPDRVEQISRAARILAQDWTIEGNAWQWEQAYMGSGPGRSFPSLSTTAHR